LEYSKPWLSIDEQLAKVIDRGMVVDDPSLAKAALASIGYYRLSAYWYAFRKSEPVTVGDAVVDRRLTSNFVDATTFKLVLDLYEFDRRLKSLMLDGIERIEVIVRTRIAHTLGRRDPFGHLHADALHGSFSRRGKSPDEPTEHERWLKKYDERLSGSKEEFVAHFKRKYGSHLPIWVAVELFDFGQTSFLYKGLQRADKIAVAQDLGMQDPDQLGSWLRVLNYIRNTCAHHARLWNKNMTVQPTLPKRGQTPSLDHLLDGPSAATARVYASAALLAYLLRSTSADRGWLTAMKELVSTFPASSHTPITPRAMGFPAGWQALELWA